MQAYEVMREVSKLLEQAKEQTIGSDSGDDKMCVDIQSVRDGHKEIFNRDWPGLFDSCFFLLAPCA